MSLIVAVVVIYLEHCAHYDDGRVASSDCGTVVVLLYVDVVVVVLHNVRADYYYHRKDSVGVPSMDVGVT